MGPLRIDGACGEGGGQVLRTSLALSALTGRPVELVNIRAGRPKPGLRPQHLAAVRALAAISGAELTGTSLNSQQLVFEPSGSLQGGTYTFDVTEAARGGSAGATTLIAQAVLLPLAFAKTESKVVLRGGTHVPFSPPFHYLRDVCLPAMRRLNLRAEASLHDWGWYPVGGGGFSLTVRPLGHLEPLTWTDRGELERVVGLAAVTNLPAHIPQRMANRATNLLRQAGLASKVQPVRERGPAAGAGIFLTAEYEHGCGGFSALGRKGKPAEEVAQEACDLLFSHHRSPGAVDPYLADQLILPLALARGKSTLNTSKVTQHTLTVIHVVSQLLDARILVQSGKSGGTISIEGIGYHV